MTRGHDGYDFLSAESLAKQRAEEASTSLPVRPPVADNDQAAEFERRVLDRLGLSDEISTRALTVAAEVHAEIAAGWRKTEGA